MIIIIIIVINIVINYKYYNDYEEVRLNKM